MRKMYDAIYPQNIPADAEMVALYLDGSWPAKPEDWARFTKAVKLGVTVNPYHNAGHILDVEYLDATPAQAPAWIRMRQLNGLSKPTIYCNRSTRPLVEAACKGLFYDLWIAAPGVPHIEAGSIATQYDYPGIYDVSLVLDSWYPSPLVLGDNVTQSEKAAWTFIATLLGKGHPPTQDDYNAYDSQYHDNGDNVQDIVSAICTHPEALAYQARLAKTLAFVDPEDGNAPSTTDHKHIAGGIQS